MHDITKSSRYEQDIRLGARRVSATIGSFCIGFCLENPYSSEERPTQVLAIVGQRDQRGTKVRKKKRGPITSSEIILSFVRKQGCRSILAFIVSIVFGEYYRGLGWVGVLIFVIGASSEQRKRTLERKPLRQKEALFSEFFNTHRP
jgi:hypothetical protein